jgi:hypothetical protein
VASKCGASTMLWDMLWFATAVIQRELLQFCLSTALVYYFCSTAVVLATGKFNVQRLPGPRVGVVLLWYCFSTALVLLQYCFSVALVLLWYCCSIALVLL